MLQGGLQARGWAEALTTAERSRSPAQPRPHLPLSTQGHLLPGLPVHQVWRGGTQGVPGGDSPLQDQ